MRRSESTLLAVDISPELCLESGSPQAGPIAAEALATHFAEKPGSNWDAAWIDLGGEG